MSEACDRGRPVDLLPLRTASAPDMIVSRPSKGGGTIRKSARFSAVLGLVSTMLLLSLGSDTLGAQSQLSLPPVPEDFGFLQDYAGLLDPEARVEVGIAQREAFERYQTPIVVVLISHKGQYGGGDHSIEDFAREWFNQWEIGYTGPRGEFANRGILFLVSRLIFRSRFEGSTGGGFGSPGGFGGGGFSGGGGATGRW